jgi:hypothetical protein
LTDKRDIQGYKEMQSMLEKIKQAKRDKQKTKKQSKSGPEL